MNLSSLFILPMCAMMAVIPLIMGSQAGPFLALIALIIVVIRGASYLDPIVCFMFPWAIVSSFMMVDLTQYNRPLDEKTLELLGLSFAIWCIIPVIVPLRMNQTSVVAATSWTSRNNRRFQYLVFIYAILSLANYALAGYVPFFSLLFIGDSGYLSFGVPGIYGFYNAFSNALGILAFYVFLVHRSRFALLVFLLVAANFILCVSRQNVISLIFEAVMIYSLVRRPFKLLRIGIAVSMVLLVFALLGEARSGSIHSIARVKPEYNWVPKEIVWPYSYGYMNLLNLDNAVTGSPEPLFSGSSLANLIPSRWRPENDYSHFLETSQFNVSSYMFVLFIDAGRTGVLLWTALWSLATVMAYVKAIKIKSFFWISAYSVLSFCACFSFFTNFWTYLPIVFQIFFFMCFAKWIFAKPRRATVPLNRYMVPAS